MKKLLLAAVAGAALLTAGAARAAPSLSIEVFEGATLLGSTSSGTGSALLGIFSALDFSNITVSASGVPSIPSPNLSSFNLNTTASNPAALTVWVTQTGLTNPYTINLASSFTINALTGQSETVAITNYIDASNTPFGTATQIASDSATHTVVGDAGPIDYTAPAMPLFSETQKYVITFDAGHESVSLSAQIVDAPEPASLALVGAGLFGIGLLKRSKKASG